MRPNELDIGPLPEDAHARLIHLSNVLGRLLVENVRNPAKERAHAMPGEVRQEAETLVDASCTASSRFSMVSHGRSATISWTCSWCYRLVFATNGAARFGRSLNWARTARASAWASPLGWKATSARCPPDSHGRSSLVLVRDDPGRALSRSADNSPYA